MCFFLTVQWLTRKFWHSNSIGCAIDVVTCYAFQFVNDLFLWAICDRIGPNLSPFCCSSFVGATLAVHQFFCILQLCRIFLINKSSKYEGLQLLAFKAIFTSLKLLASLIRNYFSKQPSGAPLHTLLKLCDVPVGFEPPPPPYFEAVCCFICGRRRVSVARYWMLCLVLCNSHLFPLPCGAGSKVPREEINTCQSGDIALCFRR